MISLLITRGSTAGSAHAISPRRNAAHPTPPALIQQHQDISTDRSRPPQLLSCARRAHTRPQPGVGRRTAGRPRVLYPTSVTARWGQVRTAGALPPHCPALPAHPGGRAYVCITTGPLWLLIAVMRGPFPLEIAHPGLITFSTWLVISPAQVAVFTRVIQKPTLVVVIAVPWLAARSGTRLRAASIGLVIGSLIGFRTHLLMMRAASPRCNRNHPATTLQSPPCTTTGGGGAGATNPSRKGQGEPS